MNKNDELLRTLRNLSRPPICAQAANRIAELEIQALEDDGEISAALKRIAELEAALICCRNETRLAGTGYALRISDIVDEVLKGKDGQGG